MKIEIETIPHAQQRYPTAGDWYYDGETLKIKVSELGDWRYELLVAVHELVEVSLCKNDGVTQESVDAFDIDYEKRRQPGDDSEPGDSSLAPYKRQHCMATAVERALAAAMNVDWSDYDDTIFALP